MDPYIQVEAAGETYTLIIPSVPASLYGPRVISDIAELNPPAGFNYVQWKWLTGTPLQDVFASLKDNDVLVLPEDEKPYLIDTSHGFRQDSRHDVAMARTRAGIIGMGPGAVIDLAPSSFSQGRDSGSAGNRNKVLECWVPNAIIANFTMYGRDLGGVAFDAIKGAATNIRMENLYLKGAHRGWSAAPPGEAGGLVNHRANGMIIRNCEVDCRDKVTGLSVGPSPVMLNVSNDCLIENSYFHHANIGAPTFWSLRNVTTRNVRSEYNSSGFNHELVEGTVTHEDATIIIDRAGRTSNKGSHISIGTNRTSAVYNVDAKYFDAGYESAPEKFFIQLFTASYTPWGQKDSDIHITKDGQAVPTLIGR